MLAFDPRSLWLHQVSLIRSLGTHPGNIRLSSSSDFFISCSSRCVFSATISSSLSVYFSSFNTILSTIFDFPDLLDIDLSIFCTTFWTSVKVIRRFAWKLTHRRIISNTCSGIPFPLQQTWFSALKMPAAMSAISRVSRWSSGWSTNGISRLINSFIIRPKLYTSPSRVPQSRLSSKPSFRSSGAVHRYSVGRKLKN